MFGTNWYYRLDLPGVKEFVAAYQATYPGVQIKVPGNTYYNGYMATRELLRATERAGSTNNIKVIKELENLKVSRARPDAGLRRVHEPGDAPVAADDLHGDVQRRAGGQGRHLQDPRQAAAEGSRGSRGGRCVQARILRDDADLRNVIGPSRGDRCAPRDAEPIRWISCSICCRTWSTAFCLGLLFALIALGFMLIVGVMETINLAHGSLFALGMYVALFVISPKLGWFPALQDAYLSLPLGTRYLVALCLAPIFVGAVRDGHRGMPAPHVRQGSAVRTAVHFRRRAGDRGADTAHLGFQRKAAAAARRRSPARFAWAT